MKIALLILLNFLEINSFHLKTPDDVDMWRNTTTLILSRGFQVENHTVVTEDYYILTMFRIVTPKDRFIRKQPVYLQHGGASLSDVFLVNTIGWLRDDGVYVEKGGRLINKCNTKRNKTGNAQTLGFVLASCGYDVWLGNFRGNTYSNRHLYLKTTDPEFWNSTLTDLALLDTTAMINYILMITKYEKVSYVGHSLGGLTMYMLLAEKPEFADKLNVFISLSATVSTKNLNAIYKSFFFLLKDFGFLLIPGGFTSPNIKLNKLLNLMCNPIIGYQLCQAITQSKLNMLKFSQTKTRVKASLVKTIDRVMTKSGIHAVQILTARRYQHYDFGCAGNLIQYRQCEVPRIRLQNIRLKKIAVFYGTGDQISSPEDIRILQRQLNVPIWRKFQAPNSWGHYDYILNREAGRWSTPAILKFLNEAREN